MNFNGSDSDSGFSPDFFTGFNGFFKFRDPEDVFREVFDNDIFSFSSNNAFKFGFGNLQPFAEPFSNAYSSFTTFSSNFDDQEDAAKQNGQNWKKTTTSTKYVNGVKVETRR